MNSAILSLDPATYERHALHQGERAWQETNCYVDLWIELLHAFGLDPVAAMAFTVAMDFEGDQWTFFKQPLADLYILYGIDVQELAIWRPLIQHVVEQVRLGKPVLMEVDAYYLPDTAGVSYQIEHTKTTIAVQAIDLEARTMGYFHNAGYFTLSGDDFDNIFRLKASADDGAVWLPPYTEIVKLGMLQRRSPDELARQAADLLRVHLGRRPTDNPVRKYQTQFASDVQQLSGGPMQAFHVYAFATLRQCGACAEIAATFLRWLEQHGERDLEPAARGFETIATGAKTLQFQVARAVNAKRTVDFAPMLAAMAVGWDLAIGHLVTRYGD
ncbi:MAG TPA: DUF1839 family protein [Gemmatimonadaceae bacterium]|nr:DUF1839 family protein [Gemmatimonadaceae bacterium]